MATDIFIDELLRITRTYVWKMHYTTFCELIRIAKRYHWNNSTYMKGDMGEEYVTKEYIYPAIHKIPNIKYRVDRGYTGRRKGNGDIDARVILNNNRYMMKYLAEIKNLNEHYEIDEDAFYEKVLHPLETADKHHKYKWILFIPKNHIKHIRRLCRLYDITIIPTYLFLDREQLIRLGYLFEKTYNSLKKDKSEWYYENLEIGCYRPKIMNSLYGGLTTFNV